MATNDSGDKLVSSIKGLMAPERDATSDNVARFLYEYKKNVSKGADANVNSVWTLTLDTNTVVQLKAESFKLTLESAVTETNTNLATINLVYNNGAGGSDTVVFTGTTAVAGGIGNVTAGQPKSVSLNVTNSVIPRGSCVQVKITKSGAGGLGLSPGTFEFSAVPV